MDKTVISSVSEIAENFRKNFVVEKCTVAVTDGPGGANAQTKLLHATNAIKCR